MVMKPPKSASDTSAAEPMAKPLPERAHTRGQHHAPARTDQKNRRESRTQREPHPRAHAPMAAVVLPAASSASVISRTAGSMPDISAMPPALSYAHETRAHGNGTAAPPLSLHIAFPPSPPLRERGHVRRWVHRHRWSGRSTWWTECLRTGRGAVLSALCIAFTIASHTEHKADTAMRTRLRICNARTESAHGNAVHAGEREAHVHRHCTRTHIRARNEQKKNGRDQKTELKNGWPTAATCLPARQHTGTMTLL